MIIKWGQRGCSLLYASPVYLTCAYLEEDYKGPFSGRTEVNTLREGSVVSDNVFAGRGTVGHTISGR